MRRLIFVRIALLCLDLYALEIIGVALGVNILKTKRNGGKKKFQKHRKSIFANFLPV
jgi:hypothetical protein